MYCTPPGVYTNGYSICVSPLWVLENGGIPECCTGLSCWNTTSTPQTLSPHLTWASIPYISNKFVGFCLNPTNLWEITGCFRQKILTELNKIILIANYCKTRKRSSGMRTALIPTICVTGPISHFPLMYNSLKGFV